MTVVKDLQNQIRKANRELNEIQLQLANIENSDKINAEDSIEQFDTLSQLVALREKETDLTKKIARLHNDLVNLMDGKSILPEIEPGHNMTEMYDYENTAKKSSEIRGADFEKSAIVKKKSSRKNVCFYIIIILESTGFNIRVS